MIMVTYRASRHEATGQSPNLLMYGREVRVPIDFVMGGPNEIEFVHPDELVDDIHTAQEHAYSLARDQLKKAAKRNKKNYDRRVRPEKCIVGTWVSLLLSTSLRGPFAQTAA